MATIVISARGVIEAATKVIAAIEAERDRLDNECISAAMQPRTFLGFKLKTRTTEEAIRFCRGDNYGWFFPSMYAWGDLDKAKALLKLAKQGDPVTLNEEDVRVLF